MLECVRWAIMAVSVCIFLMTNVVEHLCVHVRVGPLHLFFFEGSDAALYPELSSFPLPSQEHLVTCSQGHQPQLGSPSA